MKALIQIEFGDEREFFLHLHEIRKEVKRRIKKEGSLDRDDFKRMEFDDSNCYGDHEVIITES